MTDLLNHLDGQDIFLASKSPRRMELLTQLGIPFKQWLIEDISEDYPVETEPSEIAEFLARKKARPYHDLLKSTDILITADTIVCHNSVPLGKPVDRSDAVSMLEKLSDSDHQVLTGVCLASKGKMTSFSASTLVTFAKLCPDEISYYVDTYTPYDKAGSYGIQEWIGLVGVKSITGSYFNVMGLPIQHLYQELKKFTNYT